MTSKRLIFLAGLFALVLPHLASAHPLPGATGLLHGLTHPMTGADHILAMVAVGLWAASLGGKALWQVPLAFVVAMVGGASLAIAGVHVPAIESGVAASVLVLGLVLAAALKVPRAVAVTFVVIFAMFHGQAHGSEIPASASAFIYFAGFTLSTALLHTIGLGAGLLVQNTRFNAALRITGGAIAVCGALMFSGVIGS